MKKDVYTGVMVLMATLVVSISLGLGVGMEQQKNHDLVLSAVR